VSLFNEQLRIHFSQQMGKMLRATFEKVYKDEELSPDKNAISLAKETKATLKMFPDSGHFTFLSPCSPEMARDVPDICSDNQGVDRVSVSMEAIRMNIGENGRTIFGC